MNKIGDPQFRVMCEMWGVDKAIEAAKNMGLSPTKEQIKAEREKQQAFEDRWNSAFKKEDSMEDHNYGVFRVGQLCNIDLKELMQHVVEEKVDVTITFEPDRTEISVTPWRPYTPSCPYKEGT